MAKPVVAPPSPISADVYDEPDDGASKKASDREKMLERARKRREYSEDKDKDNRRAQREDTRFVYEPGAQWSEAFKQKRAAWGDECLEFPQLKQFINQVVNDMRQNRPGVAVHPASGDASVETADILKGLIRAIEYDCGADAVYDCGYQNAVVGGRGYWRVTADYVEEQGFHQALKVERIPDPNSVRMDPDFQAPDAHDINWCFVEEAVHKDDFSERWPGAEPVNYADATDRSWWTDEDHVIVADYYERHCAERELLALRGGVIGYRDDLEAVHKSVGSTLDDSQVIRSRKVQVYSVKWYTLAGGDQVLETHNWPGTVIPVVCCMGDEVIVDGKRMFQGLIAQAKSSQALFNYGMTNQAIHLALTPRAPYIAAAGQVEQYKNMWQNANNANYALLIYDPVTVDGQMAPPPQRTPPTSPDAGWINWTQQMTMLMKACIGMYEPSLGMRSNEVSGRAITAREKQGDTATYHYADNHARAVCLTGKIFVECIPYFYDTARIVHIIGDDDVRKPVKINQPTAPPPGMPAPAGPPGPGAAPAGPPGAGPPGPPPPSPGGAPAPLPAQPDPRAQAYKAIAKNDIRVGKYAVTVSSGPGYQSKRAEAADLTMQMVQADPALLQVAGDLIFKMQDVPGAAEIAERMRAVLPPPIQQMLAAKEAGQDPKMAGMMQQLQQLQQQLQQGQQQMQQLQQAYESLKQDKSASIAASQARQQVAVQQGQLDQTRVEIEQTRMQQTQYEALMRRMDEAQQRDIEREANAIKRDQAFSTLLLGLLKLAQPPQTVSATGLEATQQLNRDEGNVNVNAGP